MLAFTMLVSDRLRLAIVLLRQCLCILWKQRSCREQWRGRSQNEAAEAAWGHSIYIRTVSSYCLLSTLLVHHIFWRACDLNLVMISLLNSKCQDFKLRGLQFHFIKQLKNGHPHFKDFHFEASEDIMTKHILIQQLK